MRGYLTRGQQVRGRGQNIPGRVSAKVRGMPEAQGAVWRDWSSLGKVGEQGDTGGIERAVAWMGAELQEVLGSEMGSRGFQQNSVALVTLMWSQSRPWKRREEAQRPGRVT